MISWSHVDKLYSFASCEWIHLPRMNFNIRVVYAIEESLRWATANVYKTQNYQHEGIVFHRKGGLLGIKAFTLYDNKLVSPKCHISLPCHLINHKIWIPTQDDTREWIRNFRQVSGLGGGEAWIRYCATIPMLALALGNRRLKIFQYQ